MRLELAQFPVKDAQFGRQTGYSQGTLQLDKEELIGLIRQDNRVTSANIDIAFPGEKMRIVNGRDVVEPRLKVSGPGCVFPGIMGPVETVGQGRTHRMSGVTIIPSADYRPTILSGTGAGSSAILDMWGPGAEVTPFASTINIVLVLKLIDDISEWEAHATIQSAGFKVAHRLAETTRGMDSGNVEVFQLSQVDPSLPRVVYILSSSYGTGMTHSDFAYYGLPIHESLPTLANPNEFLDGAFTSDARRGNGGFITSWALLNQPVVLKLLHEHGRQLNFLGVIIERTGFPTELGKQVAAKATSKMAQLLGTDDVIITRLLVGNSFIDVMLTVQACVKKDINTVLLIPERGGMEGTDLPLIFYVPEATAMVSTGSIDRELKLPEPTKVIGVKQGEMVSLYPGDPPFDPWEEFLTRQGWRDIIGGIDWFGGMNYTCDEY
ncbi:MAG: hypothetical protein JSV54_05245 [Chloroflexota bacterium]|nr:MAG: hypothetical protein JSV54_05245 [Chloroflexota bacterium]